MPEPGALSVHAATLVNVLGYSAGAVIFGIFLFLLIRQRAAAFGPGNRMSIAAAALAFLWNLFSLVVLAAPRDVLAADLSYLPLSLLPAVLLNVALGARLPWITRAGYALSAAAVLMHARELITGTPSAHALALTVTTSGFGVLTAAAALLVLRQRESGPAVTGRLIGTMALFLFALTVVHLGDAHTAEGWPLEMLLHHSGVPLALFVLLQDYRFVLLDAFIRFLANFLLAALAVMAAAWLGLIDTSSRDPLALGVLLMGACLLLVGFAGLRGVVEQRLAKLLFRRSDLEAFLRELRGVAVESEPAFLAEAARRVAAFMRAQPVSMAEDDQAKRLGAAELYFPALRPAPGVEVVVPLRLAQGDSHFLLLGHRQGGRRYLSEDLTALARVGAQVVEQIDGFRKAELARLMSEAELRALQAQIHPHFLFNAFNTLYGLIPRDAAGARQTVLNLAEIFRYFLRTDRTLIPLEREVAIVKAYLEIEALRLGSKLETEIDVEEAALPCQIPALSVQPLVENAVKHGVANNAKGGRVCLSASLADGQLLRVTVEDTGPGFAQRSAAGEGVGLANVRQRLRLCFGPQADLQIDSDAARTRVGFSIKVNA
ncbi:MAG: hypothetical protein FJW40_04535 [Acidobacteria bacterium]|nr:hypothetical protein [Acidobacteriota bacterium]